MIKAYLAGPDVFLPNAAQHAAKKVQICAEYGVIGRPPINEDIENLTQYSHSDAWEKIYYKDIMMMEECDVIIANLTPFGGASADAGTLIEIGWFLGRGKPIFAYSNANISFKDRMNEVLGLNEERLSIESFGLPDNLMIEGAVRSGGYPIITANDGIDRAIGSLDIFTTCVKCASDLAKRHPTKDIERICKL